MREGIRESRDGGAGTVAGHVAPTEMEARHCSVSPQELPDGRHGKQHCRRRGYGHPGGAPRKAREPVADSLRGQQAEQREPPLLVFGLDGGLRPEDDFEPLGGGPARAEQMIIVGQDVDRRKKRGQLRRWSVVDIRHGVDSHVPWRSRVDVDDADVAGEILVPCLDCYVDGLRAVPADHARHDAGDLGHHLSRQQEVDLPVAACALQRRRDAVTDRVIEFPQDNVRVAHGGRMRSSPAASKIRPSLSGVAAACDTSVGLRGPSRRGTAHSAGYGRSTGLTRSTSKASAHPSMSRGEPPNANASIAPSARIWAGSASPKCCRVRAAIAHVARRRSCG